MTPTHNVEEPKGKTRGGEESFTIKRNKPSLI